MWTNYSKNKGPWLIFAAQYLLLLAFISCNDSPDKQQKKALSVFKYNQSSGISSLDPAYASNQANIWSANQLFNGLLQLDDSLNIRPCLAKHWSFSEDRKIIDFTLRDDVYFHENECFTEESERLLTAEDVAYSFARILDAEVASPGAWIFRDRVDEDQPFQAVNDTIFRLRLAQPFLPILSILTMQYCSVVPKEAVEFYGSTFRANPVGTGPFMFKIWQEDNALYLQKNPNYFELDDTGRQLPYLDAVKVSFIGNKKTEYLSFRKSDLDFISGIDQSYLNELLTKRGQLKPDLQEEIKLWRSPYLNTEYLGFNMELVQDNELASNELRKAINYGFDRVKMVELLRNNIGIPATAGFIPAGLPSFDPTIVKGFYYDPDLAKEYLQASGYLQAGSPEIILLTNESYKDIAIFFTKSMEKIGVNMRTEILQSGLLRDWMRNSKAMFFRGSWIADYPDGESYLAMFYGPHEAPPNYTRFSNDEFDALYERALRETDDSIRIGLYREMDKKIIAESPVIPLFYDEVVRFSHSNILNLHANPLNLLTLKKVSRGKN